MASRALGLTGPVEQEVETKRRRRRRAEGEPFFRWIDLLLFISTALVVIWAPHSVQAAEWADHLEPLVPLALLGLLLGYILARLPFWPPVAHLFSITLGLEAVLWTYTRVPDIAAREFPLLEILNRLYEWGDTVVAGGTSSDTLIFSLTTASICWLLGYASGWLVFRIHASWLVVVANALALVTNLSYAPLSVGDHLGRFFFAALVLVAIAQFSERHANWSLDKLAVDAALAPRLIIFTVVVVGSVLFVAWGLPPGGTSTDIMLGWEKATAPWRSAERELDRFFASLNPSDNAYRGLTFGRSLVPRGSFDLGDTPLLEIKSSEGLYWRATTSDRYTGQAISTSDVTTIDIAPDPEVPLLGGADFPQQRGYVTSTIRVLASRSVVALVPEAPISVSQPVELDYRAGTFDVAAIRFLQSVQQNGEYTVTSATSRASLQELRGAGEDYPDWVRKAYLQLPDQRFPERVRSLAQDVVGAASTPVDRAMAIEAFLRSDFTYSTHVPVVPPDRDWVDYLLFDSKQGYCDYFAAAMTVMLRAQGVPARVATGFAPGEYDEQRGSWVVRENHAHSWVEVYFPRYGWVNFEPSANRAIPTRVEENAAASVPSAAPEPAPRSGESTVPDFIDDMVPVPDQGVPQRPAGTPGWVIALGVLAGVTAVLGIAVGVVWFFWNQGLGQFGSHERPFAELIKLARWFRVSPLAPSQTPYEAAKELGEAVPTANDTAQQLARAYVESSYSPRGSDSDPAATWRAARRDIAREFAGRRARELSGGLIRSRREV